MARAARLSGREDEIDDDDIEEVLEIEEKERNHPSAIKEMVSNHFMVVTTNVWFQFRRLLSLMPAPFLEVFDMYFTNFTSYYQNFGRDHVQLMSGM